MMNTDQKIEAMIKGYRFTVVALSLCIIFIFMLFALIVLVYVPDLVGQKAAEAFDNAIDSSNVSQQ